MHANLKISPQDSIKAIILAVIICLQPSILLAKAWTQPKNKTFTSQKAILNLPSKSATCEEFDLSNNLNISLKRQEKTLETYLEYGIRDDLTLEVKSGVSDVHEKISLKTIYNGTSNENELSLSYQKLSLKLGLNKIFFSTQNEVASFFGILDPGEYYISSLAEKFNVKPWNIGGGIAYGRSFYLNPTFHDNFQEVSIEGKYYPKLKRVSTEVNIKLGFKAWDKWTITLASYNTFSSKVEKYNPYKAGLEAALENLVPPGRHQDFYNYRLDKFLSYSESSNINKIQLGVGCFVTKNKEIQIDLFIDPFNERNNNNSSLIISFNQRF